MHATLFFSTAHLTALLLAYILGSIPFGLILAKLFGEGDVRKIGSGNIGATNVLRTGNKPLAALTLAGDLLKGTVAILVAGWLAKDVSSASSILLPLAGVLALLGHIFPIWLGFKGGKGVATYIGVLLGLYWPMALLFGLVWIIIAVWFRYSSLASLIAVIAAPIGLGCVHETNLALFSALMSVIVILKHYTNIVRLWNGNESKIGQTK